MVKIAFKERQTGRQLPRQFVAGCTWLALLWFESLQWLEGTENFVTWSLKTLWIGHRKLCDLVTETLWLGRSQKTLWLGHEKLCDLVTENFVTWSQKLCDLVTETLWLGRSQKTLWLGHRKLCDLVTNKWSGRVNISLDIIFTFSYNKTVYCFQRCNAKYSPFWFF